MSNGTSSRGIRNNNPGNIRRSNDPWQGLAQQQTDKDFFVFQNTIYGIRALARTLIVYQDKYALCTIRRIINRWAPAAENNTEAYVQAVVKDTGFSPDQQLDMHNFADLKPVVAGIIRHENGQQPYTDTQLTKALVLAGVEPEKPSLQASRTVKGGQAATAATVGVGMVEAVREAIDPAQAALLNLAPYLEAAKWLLLIVTLVSIGVMIWARIDDRRKGIN